MSINSRIVEIIDVKASGKQKVFADFMEWSPQYVQKLTKEGGSVGIEPVTKIVKTYPDINARWLLTGEGDMIDKSAILAIKTGLYDNINSLLEMEKYLPYMTDEELKEYKSSATGLSKLQVSSKQLERWQNLLLKREKDMLTSIPVKRTRRLSNAK